MKTEEVMQERRKGGFFVILGIILIVLTPFLIFAIHIFSLFIAIFGIILLISGVCKWRSAVHEMQVSHAALHAGKLNFGNSTNLSENISTEPIPEKTAKAKCHFCGKMISQKVKYCPKCGKKIISTCPKCKNKILTNVKFCPKCGNRL